MSHYGYPQGQAWSQANQAPQQYPYAYLFHLVHWFPDAEGQLAKQT